MYSNNNKNYDAFPVVTPEEWEIINANSEEAVKSKFNNSTLN